jgi:hypothetical protein
MTASDCSFGIFTIVLATFHIKLITTCLNTTFLFTCVCFVDRCVSFCPFSFGHCGLCYSSFNGFWLPLWYLQTLLVSHFYNVWIHVPSLIVLNLYQSLIILSSNIISWGAYNIFKLFLGHISLKTFKLFGAPIYWQLLYQTKVILEMCREH